MKKVSFLILVFILSISMVLGILSGCKEGEVAEAEETVEEAEETVEEAEETVAEAEETVEEAEEIINAEKPKVGFLFDFLAAERRVWLRDYFAVYAEEYGWEFLFQDANNDETVQHEQAEGMLVSGADVLAIYAVNKDTAGAIINAASDEGVPVVLIDRLVFDCVPNASVGFDNNFIGDTIAKYAVERVPEGNYGLINGDPADNNAVVFHEGFMRILQPYIDEGDITIIGDQWCKGWDGNIALQHAENMLTETNNGVDVFLAQYDGLSNGCIEALKEQDLIGEVLVTGQDAELSALQRIVQGEQAMTLWKRDDELAKLAADVINAILLGEPLKTDKVVNNETADIPAYEIRPVVVDKDNIVDLMIKTGFRTIEEVFENVPEDERPEI